MRFFRNRAVLFLSLFGIGLAVTVPVFLAIATDDSSSPGAIVAVVTLAVFAAAGFSGSLIAIGAGCGFLYAKRRKPAAAVALWALDRVAKTPSQSYTASGIGARGNELVIRLSLEPGEPVEPGEKFVVSNPANKVRLGVMTAVEVGPDSFLCVIFDRMGNEEFWVELESRMNRDFSPPGGVVFTRHFDAGIIAAAKQAIRVWSN